MLTSFQLQQVSSISYELLFITILLEWCSHSVSNIHENNMGINHFIDSLCEVQQWHAQAALWPHMLYTNYIIPVPVYVCKTSHVYWHQNYANEQRNVETLCISIQTKSSQSHYHIQTLHYLSLKVKQCKEHVQSLAHICVVSYKAINVICGR